MAAVEGSPDVRISNGAKAAHFNGFEILQSDAIIGAEDLAKGNTEVWLLKLPSAKELDWQSLVGQTLEIPNAASSNCHASIVLKDGSKHNLFTEGCRSGVAVAPRTGKTHQAVRSIKRTISLAPAVDVRPPLSPQQTARGRKLMECNARSPLQSPISTAGIPAGEDLLPRQSEEKLRNKKRKSHKGKEDGVVELNAEVARLKGNEEGCDTGEDKVGSKALMEIGHNAIKKKRRKSQEVES